jgi:hypothetical protein
MSTKKKLPNKLRHVWIINCKNLKEVHLDINTTKHKLLPREESLWVMNTLRRLKHQLLSSCKIWVLNQELRINPWLVWQKALIIHLANPLLLKKKRICVLQLSMVIIINKKYNNSNMQTILMLNYYISSGQNR